MHKIWGNRKYPGVGEKKKTTPRNGQSQLSENANNLSSDEGLF